MTTNTRTDVVTGAFSYAGAAVTAELHRRGHAVRTLTGHPGPGDAGGPPIERWPLEFTDANLRSCLSGVDTLYNTYRARFPRTGTSFAEAVANSGKLFAVAAQVGVRRVVHVSITHPDVNSPYPYFRGKALVERELTTCGIPYAIARPAFLFGRRGVLINNMAWMFRHLPLVPVGDGGRYVVRGIHVDDLARLCADLADGPEGTTVDAVGPDRMTFRELLEKVRAAVAPRTPIVAVPGWLLTAGADVLTLVLRDQVLTRDEYRAMAAGLADSQAQATGATGFREWLREAAPELGRRYINDTRGRAPSSASVSDPVVQS